MNNYAIKDDGDTRKYFTIIPNIIDDMELSVYAFRLYFHIRRVAGENGACWQSTETLAKQCNISVGSIKNAKDELLAKNLITIDGKPSKRGKNYHVITITDVWIDNMIKYKTSSHEVITPINSPHEVIDVITSPGELKNNQLIVLRRSNSNLINHSDYQVDSNGFSKEISLPLQKNDDIKIDDGRADELRELSQEEDYYNNLPPAPSKNGIEYTQGQKIVLEYFSAKRLNKIQMQTLKEMEELYGIEKLTDYCKWSAKIGMSLGRAIGGMENGLKSWGKKKTTKQTANEVAYLTALSSIRQEDNIVVIDGE